MLKNQRAYYVYADHLDSPRAIADRKGQVVWRWESDPFGVGLAAAPIKSTEDVDDADEDADHDGIAFVYNLRFPGQYYDQETGLHYNTFRDYDPATGRYIQSDPIGLSGGINTYTYVGNNPINLTDPTGECPWCVAAGIGALTDLSVQLYFNGFNLKCVNWKEVAISGAAAGLGVGIAQKLGKVSTAYGGANRPTYRFFQSKGNVRMESHPISRNSHDWYSYPHWHPDFAGKPWSKIHWPLIEPMVGAPAAAYNATKDDCECQK